MCSKDCFRKPSFSKSKKGDEDYVGKSDGNASFLRAARSGNLDKLLEFLKGNVDINTCNANGLNALHLASKEGHIKVVTELLNRGANIEATTKKGNTALHIAALAGQEDIVKLLVNNEAKINVQATHGGFTPLYMAAQENHKDVVKYLLANNASQTLATEDGFTPLAVALQQGHDKVVAILLENDTRGKVRLPALHIASKKDDVKAASLLLDNDHNVDGTSKSGFTPLHIASHYGNINVGELLLKKGADPNYIARNNITPMHVASKWGRTNMVTLLLENNADSESITRDGLTPLHCAARSGHDQVVDILLEKGAVVAPKSKNGLTPLHMAAQGDHVDCARLLLFHKAPIDDVTQDYLTPLHVAAHCGNVKTAKLLLDRKCEVNARALNGFTPLHVACKKNRIKVVELLLKYGGSIEATTESGLTPLHVASFMGHMNIVVYLIQHGANPDTPTVRGETSLHLAARANQTDIMRILLRNGAQVDARAREDQTPLHIASRLGNVDNVVLLLQHGASPDATTKDLYTPLHIAAKEGHEEIAGVLIDNGASQNLTTKKGFTPLHIAAKYGNLKVAKLLLEKESDPNVQGKNGLTPLHVATHYNNNDVAHLLLENGASPHSTAKNGYTPLHIAAKKNQMDIAGTLLEYKADPDSQSRNGFTPLHLASQEGHTEMVSLLCEKNANVNCQAKNGLTPMHLAAQEDKVPVAEVLVQYGADIDPQTKAGYTPLHTACHFGQVNMIRFLLEHGANVNAKTKLGYTPLHQAAQQGHVLVINLLLKYKADPNIVSQNGQTPLSIAQRLGYISVVECLKHITDVEATPSDEKYKVMSPETMQEGSMTDSEDEGGDDTMIADNSYNYLNQDDMKILEDDSIRLSPTKEEKLMSSVASPTQLQYPTKDYPDYQVEEQIQMTEARPIQEAQKGKDMYGSYSGVSFASSFDPDNVNVDRHPVYSGFLVSFMVDARGGAMRGCRHSGVRIIVPPGKACMPTRVTCKLVKKEKLLNPPAIMEGEALASRILEMGPVNAKFLGPVIIEVPHFASLRGKEREITILRSDDGETWTNHTMEASEEAIQEALQGSFEGGDLETAEELYQKRITRILTTDFPQYFAIVSRVRQEHNVIGPEGGMLSSTVVPQVQVVFPEGTLTKRIPVQLQAQPVSPELVSKMLGNRVAVSPIVTVEPRRRKFHKPITVTIPVPKAAQKGMLNRYEGEAPTLRLLCSITGGTSPAQWEDITRETPLTHIDDTVSFQTSVSARFWLIDCQNYSEAGKMASELYREAIAVPFMSKFVVFAKQHDPAEARLRVFCMTDDKMDKTLELQEHFSEVAISRDVEVLEGKPHYVEMGGNLLPVTKSGDQLHINFHAFRENRLPFTVRIRDTNQDPVGRVAFMKEPKVARGEAPQTPICNLNIKLPGAVKPEPQIDIDPEELKRKYDIAKGGVTEVSISKAELRLTDIAEKLGSDWKPLADQLDISPDEKLHIEEEYPNDVPEQGLIMLHLWMQKNGDKATGNELEKALRKIGREDIIKQCIYSLEQITDVEEKKVAKTVLSSDFDEFKAEIGSSRDSSMRRDMSLDVSYDEQDLVKESESAAEESGSDKGSIVEKDLKERVDLEKHFVQDTNVPAVSPTRPDSLTDDNIVPQFDDRRGVIKSPSVDEQDQASRQKQEAYLALANQLGDMEDIVGVVSRDSDEEAAPIDEEAISKDKRDSPAPIEELVDKMEGFVVHGMDDRVSISSQSSDGSMIIHSQDQDEAEPTKEEDAIVPKDDAYPLSASPEPDTAPIPVTEETVLPDQRDASESMVPKSSKQVQEGLPVQEDVVSLDADEKIQVISPRDEIFDDDFGQKPSTQFPEEGPVPVHEDAVSPVPRDIYEAAIPVDEGLVTPESENKFERGPPVEEEMVSPESDEMVQAIIPGRELSEVDMEQEHFAEPDSKTYMQEELPVTDDFVQAESQALAESYPEHDIVINKLPEVEISKDVPEVELSSPPLCASPVDFEEEVLPDGTVVKRKILQTKMKKVVTRKVRRVGPDGEVIEDVVSEEVPESDIMSHSSRASSIRSSLGDARELTSPCPSISSVELGSPYESDSEKGGVRVYTDTIEGEPEVEQEVEEFEEELPDGTIVKRKVIKTRQKQTIVKRVVMEGPEDDLPSTEEQAQQMLSESGAFEDMKYHDHTEADPETSTDIKEYEETLDDGTVVKRKVVTTTESQLKTERTIIEGTEPVQGYTDDMYVDEELVQPEVQDRVERAPPAMQEQESLDEPEVGFEYQEPVETSAPAVEIYEQEVEFTPRDSDPYAAAQQYSGPDGAPEVYIPEDSVQPAVIDNTNGAPTIAITEDQMLPADEEDFTKFYGLEKYTEQETQLSPRSIASDGTGEFEDAQEHFEEVTQGRDELLSSSSSDVAQVEEFRPADSEGMEMEAAGGDMESTRLVMKKQVHKKTIIRDGKEETIITEDTHIEQDNEAPEELQASTQKFIDEFME